VSEDVVPRSLQSSDPEHSQVSYGSHQEHLYEPTGAEGHYLQPNEYSLKNLEQLALEFLCQATISSRQSHS
jgi:hypothetical protein